MESTNDEGQSYTASGEHKHQRPAGSASVSAPGSAHILIVDDYPETLLLLRHFLSGIGKVEEATGIDEALGKARIQPFDLVLIDMKLGEVRTGIDLLHALRNEPSYGVVPMIACTAYALPGDRDHLLESGFTDYISKPFTRQQVVDIVRRHVALPS